MSPVDSIKIKLPSVENHRLTFARDAMSRERARRTGSAGPAPRIEAARVSRQICWCFLMLPTKGSRERAEKWKIDGVLDLFPVNTPPRRSVVYHPSRGCNPCKLDRMWRSIFSVVGGM